MSLIAHCTRAVVATALVLPLLLLGSCATDVPPTATAPGADPHRSIPRLNGSAGATDLFISEYVEGSSNNKAIEIYNGTPFAIDLAAGGYSVQMYVNGATTPALTIDLAGTVAAGDAFVLAQSSATAAILTVADQTNGDGWFNGDDVVVLRKGTVMLDVIGQIGVDPGTEWGTGLISTGDNTLRRKSLVCAGDADGTNVFDPAVQWDGYATDTFDGLGSPLGICVPPTVPTVVSTSPAAFATDVPLEADITITFSTAVAVSGAWYAITCSSSGARTATVSGGPTAYTLAVAGIFAKSESCTVTINAAQVVNTADGTTAMAAHYSWSFGTAALAVCDPPFTKPYAIQGSGTVAAITGSVITQGVVVGDYEGASPNLRGFYLQAETGDGDPATSDAIFVFNGANTNAVNLGDVVRVAGNAGENQGQTQVTAGTITLCGTTGAVSPVTVSLPVASADYFERYEGMLVRIAQSLTVTELYQLGRFSEVVLSSGGRLRQPTDVVAPGSAALAMQAQNTLNQLLLDDDLQSQNPDPILFGRGGLPLTAANTLRGGDVVSDLTGVLTYTWAGNSASPNNYRLRTIGALNGGIPNFQTTNLRPTTSPSVGGSLKVASFNLLNYFNTFVGCTAGVGGGTTDCRGANSATEFTRQRAKTLAAFQQLNADIVGVIEIENDGYGASSAVQDLVNGLNALSGAGAWAFINADAGTGQVNALGIDAIKVGLLYKTASVTPVGRTAVLNSMAFVNGGDPVANNRPSLAQAFRQPNGAQLIVDVNHLKSKGSSCSAPDDGQGAGNCDAVRTYAAGVLRDWLASDPTDTGEPDIVILGDLNAYAKEQPVVTLESAGYANLLQTRGGTNPYSYVFDGQWGSLDHALASSSLNSQVTGAASYHINADEPSVLDYNVEFKSLGQLSALYAADEFRTSDHDPLVVGLTLQAPTALYTFSGFLSPVRPTPRVNTFTAGVAVPIRFSLGGATGMGIFGAGFPASRAMTCGGTSGQGNPFTPTVTAGLSTVTTNTSNAVNNYVWKTDTSWANSCRELVIRFSDGTQQRAYFRFVP